MDREELQLLSQAMARRPIGILAVGLLLWGCGMTTPTFPEGDLAALTPPETPNYWYACSKGLCRNASAEAPSFALPPDRLLQIVRQAALAQPRTTLAADRSGERRLDFVQLTAILRFVDSISIGVAPLPDGRTGLIIYSHSNLGRGDLGANRKRVEAWIAAITEAAGRAV